MVRQEFRVTSLPKQARLLELREEVVETHADRGRTCKHHTDGPPFTVYISLTCSPPINP